MAHITILSEDRVFSVLLARNLAAQGHRADIHLVNPKLPLSFLASKTTWDTELWVLDLSWYSEGQAETYHALAKWCQGQPQPSLLLLDDSWDIRIIQAFGSVVTLAKPFPMANFSRLANSLAELGAHKAPIPLSTSTLKTELTMRSSMIFQKWKPTYYRILVPLDGSKLAESVLPVVAAMAEAMGMEIVLLHVVPAEGHAQRPPTPSQVQATEAISDYLQQMTQTLSSQTLKVGWRVTSGSPVDDILRYADEAPADLIAMSTHGMGDNGKLPMGSVAAAVLERQTRPVLLIQPDKDVAKQ